MPLYEYRCKKCGHQFEVIQKFSDKPQTKCPKCGAALEKLLSAPAIQFKGKGWYVTDYAKKGSGKEESAAEPAKSEADKGKSEEKGKPKAKAEE